MEPQARTAITYRFECWRALFAGIIEAAATIFLLLIAVRNYQAAGFAKAIVAGGGSLGLMLAPWLVSRVQCSGQPVAQAASRLAAIGAASFILMAVAPALAIYVAGCVVALTTFSGAIPLLTQMYQENYPQRDRGRRFARTMMIRIGSAALFSYLAGRTLSQHPGQFRWLLLVFAAACAGSSFCLAQCPSRPLTSTAGTHPFRALRYLREDRLFRQTIISWIFLGFATLMMAPLRVEYLANAKYHVTWRGQLLTAGTVALLTGVIPNIARLVLNPLWGWLFDHMNFFILRITLNLGFILGIVSFFTTGSEIGLVAGGVFFGVSSAGADVAWSLWVTKFAPPERVADYMSVHTFFTGVRGMVAPLIAFYLVAGLAPNVLGWISVGLILIACSFLIPEIKFGQDVRAAVVLIEQAPEQDG
jgi:MFS family permease